MNKQHPIHPTTRPASPQPMIGATARPVHRETALPWTSCLPSKPERRGLESALLPLGDDRAATLFTTTAVSLSAWDPAGKPKIWIRRENPVRRENAAGLAGTVSPAAPVASPPHRAGAHQRPGEPTPEKDVGPRPSPRMTRKPVARSQTPHGQTPQGKTPSNEIPPDQTPQATTSPHEKHEEHPIRRETTTARIPGPLRNGNPRGNPNLAPRCGARTRRGGPCKGPAMKNGKCRMHGGASTGPRTAEGRARIAAARTIHGVHGAAMRKTQAAVTAIAARGRMLCAMVRSGLKLEALVPMLRAVHPPQREKRDRTPYAVSGLSLIALPLTARQGRDLVRMIHAAAARPPRPGQDPTRVSAAAPHAP